MAVSYFIGLDLGGTNIKGGVVDVDGEVAAKQIVPTEADEGPEHVMGRMAELAGVLVAEAGISLGDIAAVGVGTPGPLDEPNGIVLRAPNMAGWTRVPLRDRLKELIGRPVVVVNDANAAAYGEYWKGAGTTETDQPLRDMILLTLGTGIGGGVVLRGRIFKGAHGAGTELGHTIVEPTGRACGCGQYGCLETVASATAIARDATEQLQAGQGSSLTAIFRDNGRVTCQQVFDAAETGDPMASRVVDTAAGYLGIAAVNLTRIFDPERIVFGGGVMMAGDLLLNRIRAVYERRTWKVRPSMVEIVGAKLGNDAGFIGAAGMAADEVKVARSTPD